MLLLTTSQNDQQTQTGSKPLARCVPMKQSIQILVCTKQMSKISLTYEYNSDQRL